MRSRPSHFNIRTELVLHTTSGASRYGPSSSLLHIHNNSWFLIWHSDHSTSSLCYPDFHPNIAGYPDRTCWVPGSPLVADVLPTRGPHSWAWRWDFNVASYLAGILIFSSQIWNFALYLRYPNGNLYKEHGDKSSLINHQMFGFQTNPWIGNKLAIAPCELYTNPVGASRFTTWISGRGKGATAQTRKWLPSTVHPFMWVWLNRRIPVGSGISTIGYLIICWCRPDVFWIRHLYLATISIWCFNPYSLPI